MYPAHASWIFVIGCVGHQVSSMTQMSLSNKHLKMGAVPFPPFLVKDKDKNGSESYSGLLWDLVEYIQKARNCSLAVVTPTDGLWGDCYGSNNCTGMIGLVNRSQVDFAIGKLLRQKLASPYSPFQSSFQDHFIHFRIGQVQLISLEDMSMASIL